MPRGDGYRQIKEFAKKMKVEYDIMIGMAGNDKNAYVFREYTQRSMEMEDVITYCTQKEKIHEGR